MITSGEETYLKPRLLLKISFPRSRNKNARI